MKRPINTTDYAVQILHIPTGLIVRCQDGRSQIKNKDRALSILRPRLLESKQAEENAANASKTSTALAPRPRKVTLRSEILCAHNFS